MGGVGVEIRSPTFQLVGAHFESKLRGAGDQPYVRIGDSRDLRDHPLLPGRRISVFSGGLALVSGCRFGGEVGKGLHGPPRYAVVLEADHAATIAGVRIADNWFLGWTGGAAEHPDDSGWAAVRVAERADLCTVSGNFFRHLQYGSGSVIDNRSTEARPGRNLFAGNALDTPANAPVEPGDVFTDPADPSWTVS